MKFQSVTTKEMRVIKPMNDEKTRYIGIIGLCVAVTMNVQLSAARRVVNRHFSIAPSG
jgi:hypothetical protein